jgi:hypothetical protein
LLMYGLTLYVVMKIMLPPSSFACLQRATYSDPQPRRCPDYAEP